MGNRSASSRVNKNLTEPCLIWLDASINSKQNIIAQEKLRRSFHHLLTFDDDKQCVRHIRSISNNDKVTVIVSGKFGRTVVPKIAELRQIISIYVYCKDKEGNQRWAKRYPKVKDVVDRLDDLLNYFGIDQSSRGSDRIVEEMAISVFDSETYDPEHSTTELNGQFIYKILLIDCLIRMERSSDEEQMFIDFFKKEYQDEPNELKILEEFKNTYYAENSINWYTKNTFIYQRLNKAFRVQDIELLYQYRFFIRDLAEQLNKERYTSPVHVYRGQVMSKEEVETLKKFVKQFISMNTFVSTSLDRNKARSFIESKTHPTHEKVFFEIYADPRLDNIKAFRSISANSDFPGEQEILFMPGSIFRVVKANLDEDGIWNFQLTLSSNNDKHLQSLIEYMQSQLGYGETNLYCFAGILQDMGKLDDAEKYYEYYLKQLPDNHPHVSACYHALGIVTSEKKNYELSLMWYKKLLELDYKKMMNDTVDTANVYNSIANAYHGMGNHIKALNSYERALKIWRNNYGEEHTDIAMCLDNIANVYQAQEKHAKALSYHKQALEMRLKTLPTNHPDIGISYSNIGTAFGHLHNHSLAVQNYESALEIFQKSLDPSHHYISKAMENVAAIYEQQSNYQKAQLYYKKTAKIYRRTLPANDSSIARLQRHIFRVSKKIKDPSSF